MHLRKRLIKLSPTERDGMRVAGRFNASLLDAIRAAIRPGVTTEQVDNLVREFTYDHGHVPAPLGYQGYPRSCCTSVNDVICHGIPDAYVLKEGDIVNVDVTTIVHGWHGDSSETFLIGEVSPEAKRLVQCAFDCLYAGIDNLEPGCRVSNIGDAVAKRARRDRFSVVRKYVGHGVEPGSGRESDDRSSHSKGAER